MTSEERHEKRYQRRKAAREAKREEQLRDALDFDSVCSFGRLYRSALLCYRGVSWKASVQSFKARGGIHVSRRFHELQNGVFKLRDCPGFTTRERGRERRINSIHIADRVPQKCLCKYALKPVLHRGLIYDNYASQEGKGTDKARKRLKCMLERHIRRHGMAGGLIIFDFKGFFDNIRHELIRSVLEKNFDDPRIVEANMMIVRQARKETGIILGSENSQDFAISTPSALDHTIKERLGAEGYGRYMDDGWIIHYDLKQLKGIFCEIEQYARQLGFQLNLRKTRVLRFGRPFTVLHRKYSFTKTGGIIVRPARDSVIRERRKLKRLYKRCRDGTLGAEAGYNSLNAWKSSLRGCKCRKIVRSMERLYDQLYIQNWLNGEEERHVL